MNNSYYFTSYKPYTSPNVVPYFENIDVIVDAMIKAQNDPTYVPQGTVTLSDSCKETS